MLPRTITVATNLKRETRTGQWPVCTPAATMKNHREFGDSRQ
jgi:hypothetical protein